MDNQKKNAGFTIRLFALILDFMLTMGLLSLPVLLVLRSFATSPDTFLMPTLIGITTYMFVTLMLFGILTFIYVILTTSRLGGSFGKLLYGLRIVAAETEQYLDTKTTMYRFLPGYAFSSAFFGLGFIRVIKNEKNLAWHDELFGTKVILFGNWLPGAMLTVALVVYWVYFFYSIASVVTFLVNSMPY